MDWVKLRSDYFLKVAIACLDDAGEVMYARGLAFCGAAESGGFIPDAIVPTLGRRNQVRTAEAVAASGKWERVAGGYAVVGWAEDQAELEALIVRRQKDVERKRRARTGGQSADDDPSTGADIPSPFPRPKSREEEETPTDVGVTRDDVERLCAHLADRIEANGSKRPTITAAWRKAARLLIDADHRTETQVMAAIDWCQADDFWRANVLSMPTLREKYDQMRLQAERNRGARTATTSLRVDAALALADQLDQEFAS